MAPGFQDTIHVFVSGGELRIGRPKPGRPSFEILDTLLSCTEGTGGIYRKSRNSRHSDPAQMDRIRVGVRLDVESIQSRPSPNRSLFRCAASGADLDLAYSPHRPTLIRVQAAYAYDAHDLHGGRA